MLFGWAGAVRGRSRAVLHAVAVGGAALALSVSLLVAPSPQQALADPPLSVAEAKTQISQLETDAEALDQQYVGVQEKLVAGRKRLAQQRADLAAQTAKVARIRRQVGQVALAQFQNRNLDTAAQLLFNSDTEGFLSKVSTVEKVSENQNATLQDYQAEQARLTELERSAETAVALLREQKKELTKLRAASEAKLVESKRILQRLTLAEQQRIKAEEDRASKLARQRAEAAREQRTSRASTRSAVQSGTRGTVQAGTAGPVQSVAQGSGRGATALGFAKRQLGKPYRFSAAGPDAYDCSGLTSAAWRAAGVSLPRTSQAQFHVGRPISKSQLQPGDLVFFYSGISHVGLYAGNGMLLHAPRPGRSVEYIKMSYMPFAGARRPG